MTESTCEVCAAIKLPRPVLFETVHWTSNLDANQAYPGRSYITLKRHCGDLIELTSDEWLELQQAMRTFETGMRKAFGADLFNWTCLMNNAFQYENPQPHVHWHARPRYRRPASVAGEHFIDERFGHHYDNKAEHRVDAAMLAAIQRAFKEAI
jgi:diadenosine tetraphosphate (Ap4A) HIT family hydrolase